MAPTRRSRCRARPSGARRDWGPASATHFTRACCRIRAAELLPRTSFADFNAGSGKFRACVTFRPHHGTHTSDASIATVVGFWSCLGAMETRPPALAPGRRGSATTAVVLAAIRFRARHRARIPVRNLRPPENWSSVESRVYFCKAWTVSNARMTETGSRFSETGSCPRSALIQDGSLATSFLATLL